MPLATKEETNAFAAKHGTIRLACEKCDTEEADGVRKIPNGWTRVGRFQSLRQSLSVYEGHEDAPEGYSLLHWFTHLGYCPECSKLSK